MIILGAFQNDMNTKKSFWPPYGKAERGKGVGQQGESGDDDDVASRRVCHEMTTMRQQHVRGSEGKRR